MLLVENVISVKNAISATSRAANGPSGPAMRAIAPRAAGNTMARPVRIAGLRGVASPADSLARAVVRVGMAQVAAAQVAAVPVAAVQVAAVQVAVRAARARGCALSAVPWGGVA